MKWGVILFGLVVLILGIEFVSADCVNGVTVGNNISQYGITWFFDKEYECGQFVNGDYWVKTDERGIVNVTHVTVNVDGNIENAPKYNNNNKLMHGSMVNPMGNTGQAYDERALMWNSNLMVVFPRELSAWDSLMTAVSRPDNDPRRPDIIGTNQLLTSTYLLTMGVLTVLPYDSINLETKFRPPYSYPLGGSPADKPLYDANDINWNFLPNITPVSGWPGNNSKQARRFQRVVPMHVNDASSSLIRPLENSVNYYRDQYNMEQDASLMMFCEPTVIGDSRENLVKYFIQYGIDSMYALRSYVPSGERPDRQITSWPSIFASIMLNDPDLRNFPVPAENIKDRQMYYATHWANVENHPGFTIDESRRQYRGVVWDDRTDNSHETYDPSIWHTLSYEGSDGWKVDSYRRYSYMYVGTALAARLMNARDEWNQPAFFDYVDRWMMDTEPNDYWEYFLQSY